MTINLTIKTAKLLEHQREKWEKNVNTAHDNGLYALLDDCLDFYNDLDGNPEQIEELVAHLKAQDIKGNKGTHVSTLIVRAVFDQDKDKRTFSYAKTLKLAVEEKPSDVSMHEFIVSRGGVEAIRRGGGCAKKAAETRVANLIKASEYFSKSSALGSPITVTDKSGKADEGRLFIAIMREEADGGYSMVYETAKESVLNSAFADARKSIPDEANTSLEESDQRDATEASDEASPATGANVSGDGTEPDSAVEPDPVDADMEADAQGDTKPDEGGPDLTTGNGNLRSKTMHVKLPLAVQERLAGLAA